jgi:uncharacterized protein YggE
MKNNLIIFWALFCGNYSLFSQNMVTDANIIEVTGTADTLIVPNELLFRIVLKEKIINKEKVLIAQQEAALKDALGKAEFDIDKNLNIYDVAAVYTNQKRSGDVVSSKIYQLKLTDPTKVEALQVIADELNVSQLDLISVSHTEIERFRKETKIRAMRAARDKATYLLESIGQKLGKPRFIQEITDVYDAQKWTESIERGYISANDYKSRSESLKTGESLTFSRIKLKYNILAKFEIL